jgi:hypothetical protein
MRKCLGVLLIPGMFLAAQSITTAQEKKAEPKQNTKATVNKEEIVARIKKYREAGEQKIVENKFTRKEVALTGENVKETIRQKWEKMHAYYEGTKLVRIQLYPRKGVSERTEEFYLMDNKLVFAFIQDKGPKHEGRDAGEPGKELYFHDDKVIQFDDRSGEPATNVEQEKKMYETRLPYEISELLEILKKS